MATMKKPLLKSRAIVYVPLCQGNHVAAALFDWVLTYTEIESRLRYLEPFYPYVESAGGPLANPGPFEKYFGYQVEVDANLLVNLSDLRAMVTPQLLPPGLVTDEELREALNFLQEARLVHWFIYGGEDSITSDTMLAIGSLFFEFVDEPLATLYYGHRVTDTVPLFDITRERRIVREQRSRAARIGQAASLTFEEWIETVTHFQGHCAFSSDHPYEVLEHFIPVTYGGGTTIFNCIPACQRCNAIKADRLPADLRETRLGEALPRIQEYLDQRREHWLRK